MDQFTQEQAIQFAESGAWKELTYRQRAEMQIQQELLAMPIDVFQEAIEKTVGRPVFTHELGLNVEGLKAEIFEDAIPPTLTEIIEMIPEDKRVVMGIGEK